VPERRREARKINRPISLGKEGLPKREGVGKLTLLFKGFQGKNEQYFEKGEKERGDYWRVE